MRLRSIHFHSLTHSNPDCSLRIPAFPPIRPLAIHALFKLADSTRTKTSQWAVPLASCIPSERPAIARCKSLPTACRRRTGRQSTRRLPFTCNRQQVHRSEQTAGRFPRRDWRGVDLDPRAPGGPDAIPKQRLVSSPRDRDRGMDSIAPAPPKRNARSLAAAAGRRDAPPERRQPRADSFSRGP